jgi:phosphatidate cytidylyltransferase
MEALSFSMINLPASVKYSSKPLPPPLPSKPEPEPPPEDEKLFNFSSVCDMGAYFVGVTMGKHKLCPNISPKKTIEGAVGGIASSIVVSLILILAFGKTDMLIPTLVFTIPLCVLGMIGDLFASSIKRSVGLKDYGSLIPGHGGILDRVDSILMIAPLLYLLITVGVL